VKATDTVNMSDTGKRMLALEAEVAKMPVVNQQKVVQLKREIESGVYKVDPHKVAEKLLELERVLGVKK
jgi:negative regulator of flagellin synthesis FlgM